MPLSIASLTTEDQPQLKRVDTSLFLLILLKILGLEGRKPQRPECRKFLEKEVRFNIDACMKKKVPLYVLFVSLTVLLKITLDNRLLPIFFTTNYIKTLIQKREKKG
jgi:hypothetical protein